MHTWVEALTMGIMSLLDALSKLHDDAYDAEEDVSSTIIISSSGGGRSDRDDAASVMTMMELHAKALQTLVSYAKVLLCIWVHGSGSACARDAAAASSCSSSALVEITKVMS